MGYPVRRGRLLGAFAIVGGLAWLSASPAFAEIGDPVRVASIDTTTPADAPAEPTEPVERAAPKVVIRVDLSDQTMFVYVDEYLVHTFKVSTARGGYITPAGRYKAEWTAAHWRSRKYNMAPMPWAVFFHGGYAIHGTTDIRHLGRPASHGCVRLHPENAKVIYSLVHENGRDNTLITIVR
jgi:lipoprotein-anchoring transpeptidase ErfK/SrfK